MTDKDIVRQNIACVVGWFVMDNDINYHNYHSTIATESEYCDMIVNEVQKQLLKWVSEQQNKYGE